MLCLALKVIAASNLDDSITEAIQLAGALNVQIELEFNDTKLQIYSHSDIESLVSHYYWQRGGQ